MPPVRLILTNEAVRRLMRDVWSTCSYEELLSILRVVDYRRPDVAAQLALEHKWYAAHCSPVSRARLIRGYYAFALHLACMSPIRAHVDPIELASIATPALIDSIDRFDPSRGLRFTTFASRRVLGSMTDYAREQDTAGRLARRRANAEAAKVDPFVTEHGRPPSDVELARMIGPAARQARIRRPREHLSLSDRSDDDRSSFATTLKARDDGGIARIDAQDEIEHRLKYTTPRQREVIRRCLATEDKHAVAHSLGITINGVQQIVKRTLKVMREGRPEQTADGPSARTSAYTLTPREHSLLDDYLSIETIPAIAARRGVAQTTVQNGIAVIRRKLAAQGQPLPYRKPQPKHRRANLQEVTHAS